MKRVNILIVGIVFCIIAVYCFIISIPVAYWLIFDYSLVIKKFDAFSILTNITKTIIQIALGICYFSIGLFLVNKGIKKGVYLHFNYDRYKKPEVIILLIIWGCALVSFSIPTFNYKPLFITNYLSILGLTIVSIIVFIKPEKALISVLVLLLFGCFNLVSFFYYFNFLIGLGISKYQIPDIQLNSLFFLFILFVKRRKEVTELYNKLFGQTKEEEKELKLNSIKQFKKRFEKLSDNEIKLRLEDDLVPEATAALKEIKNERNIA